MCIGLSIAFAFQFMILRSPARRLLRQAIADMMSSMTAYYILHAAFISALNPDTESMTGERAPLSVLNQVSHDLARRERAIQGQLIAIYPLLNFAKLEPDWGPNEFREDVYKRIIRSSQLFMDRLREARVIITTLDGDDVDVDSHQGESLLSLCICAFRLIFVDVDFLFPLLPVRHLVEHSTNDSRSNSLLHT